MANKKYAELYAKYEEAYQRDLVIMPVKWYETCVKEKTKITFIDDDREVSSFVDQLIEYDEIIDVLALAKKCIEHFGETFWLMRLIDWYHAIRVYLEQRGMEYVINQNDYDDLKAAEPLS